MTTLSEAHDAHGVVIAMLTAKYHGNDDAYPALVYAADEAVVDALASLVRVYMDHRSGDVAAELRRWGMALAREPGRLKRARGRARCPGRVSRCWRSTAPGVLLASPVRQQRAAAEWMAAVMGGRFWFGPTSLPVGTGWIGTHGGWYL